MHTPTATPPWHAQQRVRYWGDPVVFQRGIEMALTDCTSFREAYASPGLETIPTRAEMTTVGEPCCGCTRTVLGWLAPGVAVISALAESAGWCQWSPVRLL